MNMLEKWHFYTQLVNGNPQLRDLRNWVEDNEWGFGDRPLYWMWYKLLQKIPENSTLVEIGVYKGQTLALWRTISNLLNKNFLIVGITPLQSTADKYHHHVESDYKADIKRIHDAFELQQPVIIEGRSQDVHEQIGYVNVLYIDGSHDYDDVKADLELYSPKVINYMVVDDASCNIDMPTDSSLWYKGLEDVSRATDDWYSSQNNFSEVDVVGHNRIFRKAFKVRVEA